MTELFKFLKGYVIIKVTGDFPERFINLATQKNIYIWDIKQAEKNVYIMKMSAKAFLELRKIAHIASCKVSVIGKNGIAFKLKAIKNFYALLIGVLLFFGIIIFMSGTVTDICVEGQNQLKEEVILQRLETLGLKKWARKSSIDVKKIQKDFKLKYKDISYIAVNLNGTKAYVQVAEATKKPFITDLNMPCNIIADKDGVIETLRVKRGFPVVKEGDTVKKGQLLVSGITDSRFLTVRYVNSEADIVIRTWNDYQKEFPINKEIRTKTLNTSKSLEIILGDNIIKSPECDFDNFSVVQTKYIINLPFLKVNLITFEEEIVTYQKMKLKEAFDYYYMAYLEEIKNSLDKETKVLSVRNNYAPDKEKIRIWIELETLENTGVKQEIKKEEESNGENY